RRTFTTASFTSKSLRIPIITGTAVLGIGVGVFLLSRVSHAETQSSKHMSGNENRELTARTSRKSTDTTGRAEKEANKAGGLSQDNEPGLSVESKKSEK